MPGPDFRMPATPNLEQVLSDPLAHGKMTSPWPSRLQDPDQGACLGVQSRGVGE